MGLTKVVFGYSSAPEGCDLDASLGGHAALTLIYVTGAGPLPLSSAA